MKTYLKKTTSFGRATVHGWVLFWLFLFMTAEWSFAQVGAKTLAANTTPSKSSDTTTSVPAAVQDRYADASRLIPRDVMKASVGDPRLDNVFNTYSLSQIKLLITEYDYKVKRAKKQNEDLTRVGLDVGDKFIRIFPDSKVFDEVAIRHADLLYEKASEEKFAADDRYNALMTQYNIDIEQFEKGELKEKPTEPTSPKYSFDKVIELYDMIINNFPQSKYVSDALYNKAFIYGERLDRRDEAVALLEQLVRRYPDSRYATESHLLMGEYLFNQFDDISWQRAISHYQKVIDLTSALQQPSKKYSQALYKIGWSNFRLRRYDEAISYFTYLADDIEKGKEIFSNRLLPDYVFTDVEEEAIQYIGTSFIQIQKDLDEKKSAAPRADRYFSKFTPYKRYEPLVYQKMGEDYEALGSPELVMDSYRTLLRKYPQYENAPVLAQKVIDQYINASNAKDDKNQDAIEDSLYNARQSLFYTYGRISDWYKNTAANINAQLRGDTLSYAQKGVLSDKIDPKVLAIADSITKAALFENIYNAIDKALWLDGSEKPPVGRTITLDSAKANDLYKRIIRDTENYNKLFSRYDSASYVAAWIRAQVLDSKLNQPEDALKAYTDISRNHAWNFHRLEAAGRALGIADALTKQYKTGLEAPIESDSVRFKSAKERKPLDKYEQYFVDAIENYSRLYPHDTVTTKYMVFEAKLYFKKNQPEKFAEIYDRLTQYFPVQEIEPTTTYDLMETYYADSSFIKSEQLAKGVYYAKPNNDPNDKERRDRAYIVIAASIYNHAAQYSRAGFHTEAAGEYERVARETPKWDRVTQALENAANEYVVAKDFNQAVRINQSVINTSSDKQSIFNAYGNIINAYDAGHSYDSAIAAREKIAEVYPDSAKTSEIALRGAISIAADTLKNYTNAIRLADKYLDRFGRGKPYETVGKEFASTIVLYKITYNKNLGNTAGVFDAYGQFARDYEDDPASVQAYYRRGEILEQRNSIDSAKVEYDAAVNRNKTFKEKQTGDSRFYASESLYKLTKYLLEEYNKATIDVKLLPSAFAVEKKPVKKKTTAPPPRSKKGGKKPAVAAAPPPPPKVVRKPDYTYDSELKGGLRKRVLQYQADLYQLGGYRSIEAMYLAGAIQAEYADAQAKIDLRDKGVKGLKYIYNQALINNDVSIQYRGAGNDFNVGTKNLLAYKAEVDTSKTGFPDSTKKAVEENLAKTRDKTAEMFYRAGKVYERVLADVLTVEASDEDKEKAKKYNSNIFEVIGKINGLRDAKIFLDLAIVAYNNGVAKSKELGIDNEWVKKSEDAAAALTTILPEKADSISRDLYAAFDTQEKIYEGEVATAKNLNSSKTAALSKVIMTYAITQNFSSVDGALREYEFALDDLKKNNAPQVKQNELGEKLMKYVYEVGTSALNRSDTLTRLTTSYNDAYKADPSKFTYLDAINDLKPLATGFKRNGQQILEQSFRYSKDYGLDNQYFNMAKKALYASDNVKYAPLLGADVRKTIAIGTDADWKVVTKINVKDIRTKWSKKEYDDSQWQVATPSTRTATLNYISNIDSARAPTPTGFGYALATMQSVSVKPIWLGTKDYVPPPDTGHKVTPVVPPTPSVVTPDTTGRKAPVQPPTVKSDTTSKSKVLAPQSVKPDTAKALVPPQPVKPDSGSAKSVAPTDTTVKAAPVDTTNKAITPDSTKTDTSKTTKPAPKKKAVKKGKGPFVPTGDGEFENLPFGVRYAKASIALTSYNSWFVFEPQGKKKSAPKKKAVEKKVEEIVYDSSFVFFRKTFEVGGGVQVALLTISKDNKTDSTDFRINGDPVDFEKAVQDSLHSDQITIDVTTYIVPGTNLLAVKMPATAKTDGLKAYVSVTYVPKISEDELDKMLRNSGKK